MKNSYIEELTNKIRQYLVAEVDVKVNQKVHDNLTWVLKNLGEAKPNMKIDIGQVCATFSSDTRDRLL